MRVRIICFPLFFPFAARASRGTRCRRPSPAHTLCAVVCAPPFPPHRGGLPPGRKGSCCGSPCGPHPPPLPPPVCTTFPVCPALAQFYVTVFVSDASFSPQTGGRDPRGWGHPPTPPLGTLPLSPLSRLACAAPTLPTDPPPASPARPLSIHGGCTWCASTTKGGSLGLRDRRPRVLFPGVVSSPLPSFFCRGHFFPAGDWRLCPPASCPRSQSLSWCEKNCPQPTPLRLPPFFPV